MKKNTAKKQKNADKKRPACPDNLAKTVVDSKCDYTPKVSVIIPVYNVDKGDFRATINCLLNQTLKELEFIFVDDCGEDGSIDVVYEYAKKDGRICILKNEKNSGSGISRNNAIKVAKGMYLGFFDSDDTCDPDFYEKLYSASNDGEYEIVKGEYRKQYVHNGEFTFSTLNARLHNNLKDGVALYRLFSYEHCSAIYRTDFIREHNATYGTSYVAQDTTFQLKANYFCKKFKIVDGAYYIYHMRGYSQTHVMNKKFFEGRIDNVREKIEFLNSVSEADENYHVFFVVQISMALEAYYKQLFGSSHPLDVHIEYLNGILSLVKMVKDSERMIPRLSVDVRELISRGPQGYMDYLKRPKVSVIIPVYNVEEKRLCKTIECLLNQSLRELEFIFVDDHGTSDSMKIVRRYAEKDNRIKIVENERNCGAGVSRNNGMKVATGHYLAFFDADDLCDSEFYEQLYSASNRGSYEIVKAGCKRMMPNGKVEISPLNASIRSGLAQKKPLFTVFTYEHWTAIFRADYVKNNSATYGDTPIGEDTTFLLKATYPCKRFTLIDSVHYHYLTSVNSLTNKKDKAFYWAQKDSFMQKLDYLNKVSPSNTNYFMYVAGRLAWLFSVYRDFLTKSSSPIQIHVEYLQRLQECINLVKERESLGKYLSADLRNMLHDGSSQYANKTLRLIQEKKRRERNEKIKNVFRKFLGGKWISKMCSYMNPRSDCKIVGESPYFDSSWYLAQNLDVAKSGVNPVLHYVRYGWKEGREPGPLFSAKAYLAFYPDVARAKKNPLLHYLQRGIKERRKIMSQADFAVHNMKLQQQNEIKKLRTNLTQEFRGEVAVLQKELENLRMENSGLRTNLTQGIRGEIVALQKEIEKLRMENSELRIDLAHGFCSEVVGLQKEIENLRMEKDHLLSDVNQLRTDLIKTIQSERETCAELRSSLNKATAILFDEQGRLKIRQAGGAHCDKLRSEIKALIQSEIQKHPTQPKPQMQLSEKEKKLAYYRGLASKIKDAHWWLSQDPSGVGCTMEKDGLRVTSTSDSIYYLVNEVLCKDEYGFFDDVDYIMIDVGLNIGLTSLRMAQLNHIKKIYSFEPFVPTFHQAEKNMELNPQLAQKISIFNYGLSNEEKSVTIHYNPDLPGSMSSVKDRFPDKENVETIQLKEASEVLAPILVQHKEHVFLKVDCEGAEVEILPNLEKSGLLKKVDILIMEWHFGCYQQMIDILKRNGFLVKCQHEVVDEVGTIYAFNKQRR